MNHRFDTYCKTDRFINQLITTHKNRISIQGLDNVFFSPSLNNYSNYKLWIAALVIKNNYKAIIQHSPRGSNPQPFRLFTGSEVLARLRASLVLFTVHFLTLNISVCDSFPSIYTTVWGVETRRNKTISAWMKPVREIIRRGARGWGEGCDNR